MKLVASSAILLLEAVSFVMALYVVYFMLLNRSGEGARARTLVVDWKFVASSAAFTVGAVISLFVAHEAAEKDRIDLAIASLIVCTVVLGLLYGLDLRRRWSDDRIRDAVLLWATVWALVIFLLVVAWRWQDMQLGNAELLQIVNNGAQIIGIVIAAAMIVFTNLFNSRQQNETAQHKIYQTLELQSVQLFQWEIDHPKQVKQLWFSDKLPASEFDQYLLRQYVCQILNLFEMATRFRKEGIVAHEVYGSWVIWMWELCDLPVFQELWRGPGGIWTNYVSAFRDIMSTGVEISSPIANRGRKKPRLSDEEKERIAQENCRKFFAAVSEKFNCEVVQSWLTNNEATDRQAQAFAHRKRPGKPAKARRKAA